MIKNKSRSHEFTYHHHSAAPLHSTDWLPTFPLCPPMRLLTIGRWHFSSTTPVSSCLGPCTASCCSLNQDQNSLCGLECLTQSGPPPLHTPPASLSLFPSPWHPLFSQHPSCSVLPQSLCICHAGLCLEPPSALCLINHPHLSFSSQLKGHFSGRFALTTHLDRITVLSPLTKPSYFFS